MQAFALRARPVGVRVRRGRAGDAALARARRAARGGAAGARARRRRTGSWAAGSWWRRSASRPSPRSSSRRPTASPSSRSERPWPGYGCGRVPSRRARPPARPSSPARSGAARDARARRLRFARSRRRARSPAALLAWNTLGALAGALLAPYLLLPALGLWLAFASRRRASTPWRPCSSRRRRPARSRLLRDVALGAGWMLVISRASPLGAAAAARRGRRAPASPPSRRAAGLVAVVERADELLLQIDNHYALGGSADARAPGAPGAPAAAAAPGAAARGVPRLRHRHQRRRRRSLHAASSASRWSSSCRAWRARRARWFARGEPRRVRRPAQRGRARRRAQLRARDRRALRRDRRRPVRAVAGGHRRLYAREHFAAARAHLAPGGLFCQWLPLYQLERARARASMLGDVPRRVPRRVRSSAATSSRAIPIVALVGDAGPAPAPARSSRPARRGSRAAGVRGPLGDAPRSAFAASTSAPLAPLAGAGSRALPRNTDDRPVLEFLAARRHAGGAGAGRRPSPASRFAGFARGPARGARAPRSPRSARPRAAPAPAGTRSRVADALLAAGRGDEAGQALAAAAALLPRELFADAPADPTAAEAWHAEER